MNYFWRNRSWPIFRWSTEELLPLLSEARKKQGALVSCSGSLDFNEYEDHRINDLIRPLTREKLIVWSQQQDWRSIQGNTEMDPVYIGAEINRLIKWFNKPSIDGLIRAGIAYLWLTSIKPFNSQNEEVAFQMVDLALAQDEKLSLRYYKFSLYVLSDQQKYLDVLEETQKGDLDITAWLKWFLQIYIKALSDSIEKLKGVTQQIEYWKTWKDRTLNSRQRQILQNILDGHIDHITNRKYVSLLKTSAESAKRDLIDLTQKDILIKGAAKGRSTSYFLKKI